MPVPMDRKDILLDKEVIMKNTNQSEITINTPKALKLGQFKRGISYSSRKLVIFVPVFDRATKYSKPFIIILGF
tara:strand:+ start:334 stop:555 length:222 start_codon:yes stop_codon:yes gene_type:complete